MLEVCLVDDGDVVALQISVKEEKNHMGIRKKCHSKCAYAWNIQATSVLSERHRAAKHPAVRAGHCNR